MASTRQAAAKERARPSASGAIVGHVINIHEVSRLM